MENKDQRKYRELKKQIIHDKKQWMQEKCSEVEYLQITYRELHRKIKEAAGL